MALVIARTLAAVDVPVSDIIEDATSRQKDLEAKLGTARAACTALETEIELHVDEIVELEAFLAEAMSVVERLEHVRNAPSESVTDTVEHRSSAPAVSYDPPSRRGRPARRESVVDWPFPGEG